LNINNTQFSNREPTIRHSSSNPRRDIIIIIIFSARGELVRVDIVVFAVQTCDTRSSLWRRRVRGWRGGGRVERGDRSTNSGPTKGSRWIFRLCCYMYMDIYIYIYHRHSALVGRSRDVAFRATPKYYPTRIKKDLADHHYAVYIYEPCLIESSAGTCFSDDDDDDAKACLSGLVWVFFPIFATNFFNVIFFVHHVCITYINIWYRSSKNASYF